MKKPDNKDSGVIFQNPVLEFLSKTSPLITFTWVGLYAGLLLFLSSRLNAEMTVSRTVVWFIAGLAVWTFFEYILHRYLFHWASESKVVKRFTYILHGIHHDYPRDVKRVFMPPAPGTIFVVVFLGLFWLFMQNIVFAFLPGFLSGYFIYAYIHYIIHAKKPFRNFKFWWTHHTLHHYKYPDRAFGVSTPLWDLVFGTMPPKSAKANHLK
jgi:sterol desaturase/sphingolipid hydroxylase (fatty acid hydroxylase superfamily)